MKTYQNTAQAFHPGHTEHFTTSCWTFQGKELAFVPVNEKAIPFLLKRDLRGAFEAMLTDSIAEENALIKAMARLSLNGFLSAG